MIASIDANRDRFGVEPICQVLPIAPSPTTPPDAGRPRDGCLVVTLTGQITLASAPQVQRALLKDLAEQPLAVICDLGGVDVLDPVCASVFATLANHPASR